MRLTALLRWENLVLRNRRRRCLEGRGFPAHRTGTADFSWPHPAAAESRTKRSGISVDLGISLRRLDAVAPARRAITVRLVAVRLVAVRVGAVDRRHQRLQFAEVIGLAAEFVGDHRRLRADRDDARDADAERSGARSVGEGGGRKVWTWGSPDE